VTPAELEEICHRHAVGTPTRAVEDRAELLVLLQEARSVARQAVTVLPNLEVLRAVVESWTDDGHAARERAGR